VAGGQAATEGGGLGVQVGGDSVRDCGGVVNEPKKPPKLYAIYTKDGERTTDPHETKSMAWWMHEFNNGPRKGHVCCEVEIVRVQK